MSRGKLVALGTAALLGFCLLVGLGTWQLRRLAWKHALIERVAARVHAPPAVAPGPQQWSLINAKEYEYQRVIMRGQYLHERETLVQAVTRLGAGFWVITPFRTVDGYDVLVNRGFVPPTHGRASTRALGQITSDTTVIGLLRVSEPKGGFLRNNDSATDHWYSRDVAAISTARSLAHSAPYFVDAESIDPAIPGAPAGGLTVVSFTNDHLQYALTWFALALMIPGGAGLMYRHHRSHTADAPSN